MTRILLDGSQIIHKTSYDGAIQADAKRLMIAAFNYTADHVRFRSDRDRFARAGLASIHTLAEALQPGIKIISKSMDSEKPR